jgi:hypothetical protein
MKKVLLGIGLSALMTVAIVEIGKIVKNRTDEETEE